MSLYSSLRSHEAICLLNRWFNLIALSVNKGVHEAQNSLKLMRKNKKNEVFCCDAPSLMRKLSLKRYFHVKIQCL